MNQNASISYDPLLCLSQWILLEEQAFRIVNILGNISLVTTQICCLHTETATDMTQIIHSSKTTSKKYGRRLG